MSAGRLKRLQVAALAAGAALTAIFAFHAVVPFGGVEVDAVFTRYVYNAVLGLAIIVIVVRSVAVTRERWVWSALAGGLLSWAVANTYYSVFLADPGDVSIPSVADGLWLGFYPLVYIAVVLLVRSRMAGLRRGMWLDGIIGGLAVAALSATLVVEITLDGGLSGSIAEMATNLAYPLGDLILVSATVLVMALNGWKLERTWRLLGIGFMLFAVADGVYFWQVARDTYVAGRLIDAGWLVAALLFAAAAIGEAPARRESTNDGQRALLVPASFGLLALGLMVWGNVSSINLFALVLATLSVVAVIARMALTFAQSRHESLTDALTGLANRRRLTRDLRETVSSARPEQPVGLAIFDLNGFKGYNDRFGHPAGDALLARLSQRLRAALRDEGVAYRMGGDEFCALLVSRGTSLDEILSRALAALTESGDGFTIDAAHGLVSIPHDAGDAETAMRLSDERMYALKNSGRVPAEHQTTDVLLQVLTERHPDPGDHADGLSELAVATGRQLGINEDELAELARASRLHNIGNTAIPAEILAKAGPLDAGEWDIVRRHPAVGERILRAAPALTNVANMVRSSHERFDGTGYPDQLAGTEIPIGARIVAVCDAFDAIISERPYARRRTPQQAATELRRCAGTHFDPAVTDAFLAVLASRATPPNNTGGPGDRSIAPSRRHETHPR